ncbi:MAG TPA: RICIN domain-containing protein [Myxococcota bacterium]|nr:RICIN domain-containing protein [Myxococcota bacterium]HRY94299.1 RICIN domain-containing protein [Myxococcota bacterium]
MRWAIVAWVGLGLAAFSAPAAAGKKAEVKGVEQAYQAVRDALDEVEDADRDCREAVAKPLKRLKEELGDLRDDYDAGDADRAARKLRDLLDDAEEDCPKAVRRALKEAADALGAGAAVAPPPPPAQSQTCLDLSSFARLAALGGAAPALVREVEQQRDFFCKPGQPGASGAFSWPSGQAAFYVSGEWRYPNGQVARYVSGELRYPSGEMARTVMGEWHYPNGALARQAMGQWKTPSGRAVTPESMLAEFCGKREPKDCQSWTKWLNQDNTGFFQELAGVELGWNLEEQFAADNARRKEAKAVHPAHLGRLVKIANLNSGMCLTAKGTDKPLRQHTCKGDPDQLWELKPIEGGFYQLVVKSSSQCADVAKRKKAEGADVVPHACKQGADTQNQQFQFSEAAKDEFEILARHSEKCLDVTGASKSGGAEIQQHSCHGKPNQRWKIEH